MTEDRQDQESFFDASILDATEEWITDHTHFRSSKAIERVMSAVASAKDYNAMFLAVIRNMALDMMNAFLFIHFIDVGLRKIEEDLGNECDFDIIPAQGVVVEVYDQDIQKHIFDYVEAPDDEDDEDGSGSSDDGDE